MCCNLVPWLYAFLNFFVHYDSRFVMSIKTRCAVGDAIVWWVVLVFYLS